MVCFFLHGLGGVNPTNVFSGRFEQNQASSASTSSGFPPAGAGCITEISTSGGASGYGAYSNQIPLDAGSSLTLTSPSGANYTVSYSSSANDYEVPFSLTGGGVPLATGVWSVRGSGGKNVGSFTATTTVPQLFTSTLAVGGSSFSQSQPLNMTWTCPDPSDQVVAQLTSTSGNVTGVATCSATCSAGSYSIPSSVLKQLPVSSSGGASVLSMYFPALSNVSTFTASGISQGYFFYGERSVFTDMSLVQ
jgi:hypothetical protein